MKLDGYSGQVHLTYCTNIHAGESWSDIRASLDGHVPAIKAADKGTPFSVTSLPPYPKDAVESYKDDKMMTPFRAAIEDGITSPGFSPAARSGAS